MLSLSSTLVVAFISVMVFLSMDPRQLTISNCPLIKDARSLNVIAAFACIAVLGL
jgi:hypothetical protein